MKVHWTQNAALILAALSLAAALGDLKSSLVAYVSVAASVLFVLYQIESTIARQTRGLDLATNHA